MGGAAMTRIAVVTFSPGYGSTAVEIDAELFRAAEAALDDERQRQARDPAAEARRKPAVRQASVVRWVVTVRPEREANAVRAAKWASRSRSSPPLSSYPERFEILPRFSNGECGPRINLLSLFRSPQFRG